MDISNSMFLQMHSDFPNFPSRESLCAFLFQLDCTVA